MKDQPAQDQNNSERPNISITDDQKRSEIDSLVQNALKKRGDTAVHIAVTNKNPVLLRQLLDRGLRVFNQSEADGGTPLHRAAEIGSQECAKILLEFNADIDALNFMGQTAFHVAAEKQDYEFGKYLMKFRARRNCRSGCKKCRFFIKQIEKYDKNKKEKEEQDNQLNLLDEIERCRQEMGGPFFNKKENQLLKVKQDKYRAEEVIRTQRPNKPAAVPAHDEQVVVHLETSAVAEQIRPRRSQQQQNMRAQRRNESPKADGQTSVGKQDEIRQTSLNQVQQMSRQSGKDIIRPRHTNQLCDQAQNSVPSMSKVQQDLNSSTCNKQTRRSSPDWPVQPPSSAKQKQVCNQQKQKKTIEELEEEKNTDRAKTSRPQQDDSDYY